MRTSLAIAITIAIVCLACRGDGKSKSKRARTDKQAEVDKPFDINDVASCQPCHGAVVSEYLTSMHGRSDERYDPIYSAVREGRRQRGGPQVNEPCDTCHSPRRQVASDNKILGLGCAVCHATQSINPGAHGRDALVAAEGNLLLGPSDGQPGVAPHATGPAPAHMKDGETLCLACHSEMHDAQGVPLCRSGPAYAKAEPATGETCVSCHMQQVNGPSGRSKPEQQSHKSHIFIGPHDGWYRDNVKILARAVDVVIAWHGDTLEVRIKNETGHPFPAGFHGRMAVLEVYGFNRAGNPIWRGEAQAAAPGVEGEVLGLVYLDDKGKATLPQYAAGPPRDTRLLPRELRQFSFQPPAEVVHGRAIVWFRLVGPELAESLGMGHLLETQEKFVTKADAFR
jgi:hypothetical protein